MAVVAKNVEVKRGAFATFCVVILSNPLVCLAPPDESGKSDVNASKNSPFFEIASRFVRFDHGSAFIEYANDCRM
jgi:hypothetical protein